MSLPWIGRQLTSLWETMPGMDTLGPASLLFWYVVIALSLYFLPTIIARKRQHRNRVAIFALNLLTGWTGWGWVAALVWSLLATRLTGEERV
jgi:hypothetical protein